ncbi:MAG: glycosyltransferase family 39 protein [Chloroflexi bacterium]|nr:glycosyltransferase family 39 protein [Chloroflexota bacterium]
MSRLWWGALAVFLLAVGPQLSRPYMYDEANFAFAGEAIARTGQPYGLAGYMSERWDFSQQYQWTLWHPPLYQYLLGLSFALFGIDEVSGRLPGVVGTALTGYLVLLLGREVAAGSPKGETLGVVAAWLFLLSSYVVRSSLVLDIDGSVLLPILTLLVVLYLRQARREAAADRQDSAGTGSVTPTRREELPAEAVDSSAASRTDEMKSRPRADTRSAPLGQQRIREAAGPAVDASRGTVWRGRLLLTGLFALALWAKVTTPLSLVGLVAVDGVPRGRLAQHLYLAVIVGAGGGAAFGVTWLIATSLLGWPWAMPFEVTWLELTDASGTARSWLTSLEGFKRAVAPITFWTSPYFALLCVGATVWRLARFVRTRRAEPLDTVLLLAGVIFFTYLIRSAGFFPKYHVAMLPLWCVVVAAWLLRLVYRLTRLEVGALALGLVLATAYLYVIAGDRYLRIETLFPSVASLDFVVPLILVPGLALLLLLAAPSWLEGRSLILAREGERHGRGKLARVGRAGALALTVLFVAWHLSVTLHQIPADYSTAYWYGTTGQVRAAELVNQVVEPGEYYVAPKEVAYYARNRNYVDQETFAYFAETTGEDLAGPFLGHDIRIAVVWLGLPKVVERLEPRFETLHSVGHYVILRRRTADGGRR